jgi:ATP-dependent exoDNAse (exonuclease V) alpha subunit
MRADWTQQLLDTFGPDALAHLIRAVPDHPTTATYAADVDALADAVVTVVSGQRSTWTVWNLHAEAERLIRAATAATSTIADADLAEKVVATAVAPSRSILVEAPALVEEPASLRRHDDTSVFIEHAAARYTSKAVLDAEQRLLHAARNPTSDAIPLAKVLAALHAFDRSLDPGQRRLVTAFATDPRLLTVGLGPAGTGKTTAMRAYLHTLAADGRRLVPLATSAASAAVLAADLGVPAENLHKFLHEHRAGPYAAQLRLGQPVPSKLALYAVGPGDVILLDEAGMAGTANLDTLVTIAHQRGALVRLLGDHRQLGAVESGGALRLIATDVGAVELTDLHRFTNPDEAAATVRLRGGDTTGLDHYEHAGRIHGGSRAAMIDAAFTGWHTDILAGQVSLMIATTNTDVTALAAQARTARIAAGQVEPDGVPLHDGNRVGVGDWIVTRTNHRRLTLHGGRDFVRNGDPWQITHRHPDGSLRARHLHHHGTVQLPAAYVAEHVELLYATTAHRAQGATVDTAHVLVTDETAREHLYVAATRARHRSTLYVATFEVLPATDDGRHLDRARYDPDARAAREVLETVLQRESAERSATETIRDNQHASESLATLMPRLVHAARRSAAARYETVAQDLLGTANAASLVMDQAWPAVIRALFTAESGGWQPAQLLATALRRGPLDGADSPARILAWRMAEVTAKGSPSAHLARPTLADAERYADRVLGPSLADQARVEAAWSAVQAALGRAQAAGHYTGALLRTVADACHISQVLAWRLNRYSSTLPTCAAPDKAWQTLAWIAKAYEITGGDPGELLRAGADSRQTVEQVLDRAQTRAGVSVGQSVPPWTPMTGTQDDYVAAITAHVEAHALQLTDQAIRQRPAWTAVFGPQPTEPHARERWRRHVGVVAAYRDQYAIADDDPRHPLGPYVDPGPRRSPRLLARRCRDRARPAARRAHIDHPAPAASRRRSAGESRAPGCR